MDIFSLYLGLALHAARLDDPEIQDFDNPLGTVEIQARTSNRTHLYIRHESSLINREDGYGYNTIGIQLKVR